MNETSKSSLLPDIDEQIARLDQLAGNTRAIFQKANNTVPAHIQSEFDRLIDELSEIKRQVNQIENNSANLQALTQVGHIINSLLEPNDVLRIVMDTIIRMTKAERGFLMLRNKKGEMVIRVARNWEQESLLSSEFAVSQTVITRVITAEQPIITTDAQEDPRFGSQASVFANNFRSFLCVPI